MNWLRVAQECFRDDYRSLDRGLLTSVFALVVGVERIFHLDQMEDPGFALLTGGRTCPSRHMVGGWRRHLAWYEVDRFCRRTTPWDLIRDQDAVISLDEHSIPRWTRKFSVPKGFVTIRDKYMRCEKLYYSYDVQRDRYLTVRGTPGNVELRDVSIRMAREILTCGQPSHLEMLLDGGASKADANVRALFDFAGENPSVDFTVRACRYPGRMRLWKALPADSFTSYEEEGVCVGASPKEIRLAETLTTLKGEEEEDAVRTILCREVVPGPKKDRWHPLYTTSLDEPLEVLERFRTRQHQEQAYRIGVHGESMNAAPNGYDKDSPNRRRPRFHRGPLQMIGCLIGLVYNAIADLVTQLPESRQGAHVDTVRRCFFNKRGQLYLTPNTLIVQLNPFSEQEALIPCIDSVNEEALHIPWLNDRRLVISLTPSAQPRAGP